MAAKPFMKLLKGLFHVTLGLIVTPLFLLLLTLLHIPYIVYWYLNRFTAHIFRPDLQGCAPFQHFFAVDHLHKGPSINIITGFCATGSFDLASICRMINPALELQNRKGDYVYKRLTQYPVNFGGLHYWKSDSDFQLANHITFIHKDRATETDIDAIISQLHNKPWTPNKSLWEFIVVNNFIPGDHRSHEELDGHSGPFTACILIMHHTLCDGYSIIKLLQKFADNDSTKKLNAVPTSKKPQSTAQLLHGLLLPFKFCSDFVKFILYRSPRDSNDWLLDSEEVHWTHRQYSSILLQSLPVARIKAVKNRLRVPFQAVLHYMWAGTIRRLMLDKGQTVPKKLTAALPLPMPNHPGGMVVHATAVLLKFYPGITDPKLRLQKTSKSIRTAAASSLPIGLMYMAKMVAMAPSFVLRKAGEGFGVTLGITGIPAFLNTPEFEDHRILWAFTSTGTWRGPAGLCLTSVAIRNRLHFTFNIVRSLYPEDPQDLKKKLDHYMEAELEELEKLDQVEGVKTPIEKIV